jgi:hypothetical protein
LDNWNKKKGGEFSIESERTENVAEAEAAAEEETWIASFV